MRFLNRKIGQRQLFLQIVGNGGLGGPCDLSGPSGPVGLGGPCGPCGPGGPGG